MVIFHLQHRYKQASKGLILIERTSALAIWKKLRKDRERGRGRERENVCLSVCERERERGGGGHGRLTCVQNITRGISSHFLGFLTSTSAT